MLIQKLINKIYDDEVNPKTNSKSKHPLERYYQPREFDELKSIAESKGFLLVSSSPLTRSSYHADEDFAVIIVEWLEYFLFSQQPNLINKKKRVESETQWQ